MANIHKFSQVEADNLQLGQAGSVFEDGTTAVTAPTGRKIVAITAIANAVFTTLTPEDDTFMGRTSTSSEYNGDAFTATLTAGTTITGSYTNFTLASGSVVAYFG